MGLSDGKDKMGGNIRLRTYRWYRRQFYPTYSPVSASWVCAMIHICLFEYRAWVQSFTVAGL